MCNQQHQDAQDCSSKMSKIAARVSLALHERVMTTNIPS
jgi:hypothetical protein